MKFDAEKFRANLAARLRRQYGKDISQANTHDLFDAVSASVLEFIMPAWMATRREYEKKPVKQCYYLSAEFTQQFLMPRHVRRMMHMNEIIV